MLPTARLREEIYLRITSLAETRYIMRKAKASLVNKLQFVMLQNGHKLQSSKIRRGRFDKHVYIHDFSESVLAEIQFLEKEIKHMKESMDEIEQAMINLCKQTKYFEPVRNLKGIGDLSACILIGVIGNINDFPSAPKLASYFGIVPRVRISNSSIQSSKITKAGSSLGRSTLIQCTWVAIKYNEELKQHYERLKKTKPSKKAVVATARKFLTHIYRTMKACEQD